MEENEKQMTAEEKARKLKKQRVRQMIVSLIGVGILAWGLIEVVCMFLDFKNNETSNDAQVEQYLSPVNLRATGYIKKIYFTEHQDVKKGDTLLTLESMKMENAIMAECDGTVSKIAVTAGQNVMQDDLLVVLN